MTTQREFLRSHQIYDKLAIERLTALWALNECALGGLMHAFKLPFTGILVGGISILCITLIVLSTDHIGTTLLKSLTIVILIKASVSPYSPVTAYFAVLFQALLGFVLYRSFSINKVTVIALCAITFLESALQKLLTLTLIFGQSLWKSLDIYMDWIGKQLSFLTLSLNSKTLIYIFLSTYFISGILVGFLIIRTISLVKQINNTPIRFEFKTETVANHSKKSSKKQSYFLILILILTLIPLVYFNDNLKGWSSAIYVIIRSVVILMLWYAVIAPLLLKLIHNSLLNKRKLYQTDIYNIIKSFPLLKAIIQQSWKDSSAFKGLNKVPHFLARSIAYSLYYKTAED